MIEQLREALRTYWGYDSFRPLQQEAMHCVLSRRDSVVVLPTGGGKSLCFQAPAVCQPGLAVVVSPLISLMKDQVDALTGCGVPAAGINSSMSTGERRLVAEEIRAGRLKLLYVSPEKLLSERTLEFLQSVQPTFFAIDEAHCISDWGHDFRPEYRGLRILKERFPGVSLHAYTATATERVRTDIARELQLVEPAILVGSFDRPNLVYRVTRRSDRSGQIREVLDRHRGESGIIYCISRAEVEEVSDELNRSGYRTLPYHAKLADDERQRNQEAFIQERVETIVATVAFGMGIDKSNVRYVIHAGAPKSIEAYQQESGRAGRDGLEAECCMFYSGGDFAVWRKLQSNLPGPAFQAAQTMLAGIEDFATGVVCRHRRLIEYFGQQFEPENCNACDVCLSELELIEEPLVLAQKIISCVARLQQNFGGEYTAQVLTGSREQRILQNQHDKLSTWGLLGGDDKKHIRLWIEQLVGQGFLHKDGEFQLLKITPTGRQVLRGELTPRLLKPAQKARRETKVAVESWEGVDRPLFEVLRTLRKEESQEQGLPAWMIFSDATLRDMARRRPSTPAAFLHVHGVGEKKCEEYAGRFVRVIVEHCQEHGLALDASDLPRSRPSGATVSGKGARPQAFELFQQGKSVDEVSAILNRARSTTRGFLVEFIEQEQITDPSFWVPAPLIARVQEAAAQVGIEKMRPIFDLLGGTVSYDELGIVVACMRVAVRSLPASEPANVVF